MKVNKYKGNTNTLIVTELSQKEFNPEVIMNSGQVFRMHYDQDTKLYSVYSRDKCLTFNYIGNDTWIFDSTLTDWNTYWVRYFDLKVNYKAFNESIDTYDSFLTQAATYSKGMRILKQDLWESMVSFIISQQNNIPKIRKTIEILCEKFGNKKSKKIYRDLNTGAVSQKPVSSFVYYAFPSNVQISNLSHSALKAGTLLGYRSDYILKLAQDISNFKLDLEYLEKKLPRENQLSYLLNIKGVGPKVANCIMLYGLHDMNSYPIDTWMEKVIIEEYPHIVGNLRKLTNENKREYLEYINNLYSGYQGYIQQLQFFFKRNTNKSE